MSQQILNSAEASLQARFATLARQWKEETGLLSDSHAIAAHPAYQEVIRLGMPVVPLILLDMARDNSHWFEALRTITGENPVPAEHRGRIRLMVEDWLAWGRERGLFGGNDRDAPPA
jgi:hypothetical protein